MNVLSLFDGISCGQVALHRAGIQYENYFASEIDKYAIKITQKNYPNTIQLGDVNNWIDWNLPKIDLLIGGSPCQGFSNAGAGLNFADPRSRLFFKFVDCLRWYKPTFFMLENVKMKKEWEDVITSYMSVEPILINSALVSAQSRKRCYWTNIPNVTQPEDRHIYLKDVIEQGEVGKEFYVRDNHAGSIQTEDEKGHCLTGGAHSGGNHSDMTLLRTQFGLRRLTVIEWEKLQTIPQEFTCGVSNTQRYKAIGNGWTVDVIAHIFKGLKQWQ